jgi:hypothetical protein
VSAFVVVAIQEAVEFVGQCFRSLSKFSVKDTFSIDDFPEALDFAVCLRASVSVLDTNDVEHGLEEVSSLRFLTREGGELNTVISHDAASARYLFECRTEAMVSYPNTFKCGRSPRCLLS